jgi:phosphatidylglycerol lysyltransferase
MKQHLRATHWMAAGRMSAPFLVMGVSVWMLAGVIDHSLITSLPDFITNLPPLTYLLAAVFCCLSFWAVARYDGLAHRHFGTGISEVQARKSGFAAIAAAQTVGFGVFTGAAVRWRMLPQLGLTQALQLSTFVSVTFILTLLFVAALACLMLPAQVWLIVPAIVFVVFLPTSILMLSFAPICAPLRHRIQIPSLRSVCAIVGWASLDLTAASLAFFVLIQTPELSFAGFLPVFLLALGADLLSGAPGGVGPFELTLITLLPQVPAAELVTAIVAFRAIYYAIPTVLAVLFILGSPRTVRQNTSPLTPRIALQPVGERGILAQNGGAIHDHKKGSYALWNTSQTATLLFDPISGTVPPALNNLKAEARSRNKLACLYKCSAKTALTARLDNWPVLRIAQDCIIDLPNYDLSLPTRRGLRRKLRKAEKSGVTVIRANRLPISQMAAVDADWRRAHGPALGGTMGRFCPKYLQNQTVYLAYCETRLIAIASFHTDTASHCLDLMRHAGDMPDGTMHLIVQSALADAQRMGKGELSLAALPNFPNWVRHIGVLRHKTENPGLRQFKESFAPRHRAKYAAAPSWPALFIALADIAVEVHWPNPLRTTNQPHEQDEDYDVAMNGPLWKGEFKQQV